MGQLAIIVAVDTQAALAQGSLKGHIYMVDNNKHAGSTGQGTADLVTHIDGTQIMNWLVTGLNFFPGAPGVTLENIGGEAVLESIMVPQQFESPELGPGRGLWWGGTVDSNQDGKQFSYRLDLKIGETMMSHTSQVLVKQGFSNVTMSVPPVKKGMGHWKK
jgi:hypothetical protein